jgi:hypothetical protein
MPVEFVESYEKIFEKNKARVERIFKKQKLDQKYRYTLVNLIGVVILSVFRLSRERKTKEKRLFGFITVKVAIDVTPQIAEVTIYQLADSASGKFLGNQTENLDMKLFFDEVSKEWTGTQGYPKNIVVKIIQ